MSIFVIIKSGPRKSVTKSYLISYYARASWKSVTKFWLPLTSRNHWQLNLNYICMFHSLNIKNNFDYFYIICKIISLESPKKKRHEVIFDELSCTSVMKKRHKIWLPQASRNRWQRSMIVMFVTIMNYLNSMCNWK